MKPLLLPMPSTQNSVASGRPMKLNEIFFLETPLLSMIVKAELHLRMKSHSICNSKPDFRRCGKRHRADFLLKDSEYKWYCIQDRQYSQPHPDGDIRKMSLQDAERSMCKHHKYTMFEH